jgi:hypothetical protein
MNALDIPKMFWKMISAPMSSDTTDSRKNNTQKNIKANTSPINGNNNVSGIVNGDVTINIARSEDEKHKEKEQGDKTKASHIYTAAMVDLDSNGPGVGNSKVPFVLDGIRALLAYSGPFRLDAEDREQLQQYLNDALRCNGRDGGWREIKPGNVQGRAVHLKTILKKYIDRIQLGRDKEKNTQ